MSQNQWSEAVFDGHQKKHAAEVAALKKELEHAHAQIERLEKTRAPKKIAATPARKRSGGDIVRVIIPDTHGAKIAHGAAGAMMADIVQLDPQEIILLGDHVDCGGHLAQHHVMGYVAETSYSYEDDIAAANAFLDSLRKSAPSSKIEYIEGNHECLTPDHEVLTERGFVGISDVLPDDLVATMNCHGASEWQKPKGFVRKEYDGEIIVSRRSAFINARMTPGHRVPYYGQYMGDLKYTTAEMLRYEHHSLDIPTTALGGRIDYEGITDDELSLLGWILTDGCTTGAFRIYQSKPEGIEKIKILLEKLGYKYSLTFRERKVSPIMGVEVKESLPQGVFYISTIHSKRLSEILGIEKWSYRARNKKVIPDYVSKLSSRQFRVFLSAVIAGDGHPTAEFSASIYGSKEFLEKLQGLCVVNGIRAMLRSKTRSGKHSHWVLYVVESRATRLCSEYVESENYKGEVFCLVMPNENFFVRRNGSVHVTGNCRVERWCVTQTLRHAKDSDGLRKLYAPEHRLHLAERGIAYYRESSFYDNLPVPGVIRRGKCYFFHGISTSKNAVAKTVDQLAANCVFGHTHRAQSEITRKVGVGVVGSWNPGCLCELQPLWQHTQPTTWTHGYAVQLISENGDFLHLNIPIIDGKSLFSALVNL